MRIAVLLMLVCALSAAAQSTVDDAILDRECAQKDCRYSGLHWFTDFEAAKAEAQRSGKPIISLRLLGRLDEEVSCANSRFFRTILYPDPSIAPLMREHFVLHWQSVRPVPKITIDLGDGRFIRQTITGNSAHYLLDENGRVLDVLPGMVSPAAFHTQLQEWQTLDASTDLKAYHGRALNKLIGTRSRRMAVTAFEPPNRRPTAEEASKRAMTKAILEMPVLRRLDPKASMRELSQSAWDSIGQAMKADVVFSAPALELMARKQPLTDELLDQLRASIAADTVLNQEELHYRIHEWFLLGRTGDLESLNERVYSELFLTPLDDPWMGLKQPATFAALQD
ncbi:MAG TPA: hypothetical protein VHW00_16125 [Thermoanaerobaculia bacterium]|nr:hypothetical protein [Thermoanaerobaculia bacterium]